ncbi:hypothetical protein SteCoe_13629 [Stentor coeruleus]|uniref:Uncharacterized protein n=1 Tax=Stentor coeruleus TaxID=5963 RepID=A0A1R2C838_9CILI|nr:hypothetical protein SteCoe_13629 [Stentor coeruleus]
MSSDHMLDSALRLSFGPGDAFLIFIIFGVIVILIPITCCIIAACGAKAVLKSDSAKKNIHDHVDPLLAKASEIGHHNETYYPPQNQAYMGYPPNVNYSNYPQPPMNQAPNYQGGAYYPPPPPQGMQYGYPEVSAPPPLSNK